MAPRVSIGLPVYNGERFLPQALDSILAQDFEDFELLVADNASTDSTIEIVTDYAARDSRVSLHRADVNRGAMWNFNRCVYQSTGHYFKWAADDDELESCWLSRCVQIMDRDPEVVLCYSRTLQIDANGDVINELPSWSAMEVSARRRVREVLMSMSHTTPMFGLARREELLRTQLEGPYGASDRAMIARLAIMGKLYEIADFLFRNRKHGERSGGTRDRRMRDAFLDPSRNVRWSMPRWRLLVGYIDAMVGAPVPVRARISGLMVLPRWILRQKGNLAYDVVRLLKPIE